MSSTTQTNTLPHAALWKRLFAIVYDLLIYFAIAMAYAALVLYIQVLINGEPAPGERAQIGTLGFIGLIAVLMGFCSVCWRYKGGQTLGMKAWRLQLRREDENGSPSWGQCIGRCTLAPFMLLGFGLGYFYSIIDSRSRCAHDILTATKMVELPKTK